MLRAKVVLIAVAAAFLLARPGVTEEKDSGTNRREQQYPAPCDNRDDANHDGSLPRYGKTPVTS